MRSKGGKWARTLKTTWRAQNHVKTQSQRVD